MGIQASPAKMLGNIPTYYVTDTMQTDAGDGNISVVNYQRINGVLVPRFQCIIAACRLLVVGKKINDFAKEVFNAEHLRVPGMHVH